MGDCNINGNVDSKTKSGEMTKKHFTKQTPRLSTPQQTMERNCKNEGAKNENLEKGVGDTHVTSRRIPIAIEQPEKEELLKSETKIKGESAQKSTKSQPEILNTLLTK